ncbi:MAG: polysaccharide biosynthesis/export family protein [Phycisphaerales bacterium JB037]
MSLTNRRNRRTSRTPGWRRVGSTTLLAAAAGLAGCNVDSYLDPSVVGRWEKTPTIVPILDRIAVIEPASGEAVESSEVTVDDLVPEIEAYRIRSGDFLEIVIFGLFQPEVPERYERQVDQRGFVDLPQIGEVYADGLTREQFRAEIAQQLREMEILSEVPVISVVALRQRERTFNLIGAVQSPGTYGVPYSDYRLLEAVAVGGSINEQAEFIYVIRQVPLTDAAAGRTGRPARDERPATPMTPETPPADNGRQSPEDLESIIDDLSSPPGSPGAFGEQPGGAVVTRREPSRQPAGESAQPAATGEMSSRRQPELEPAVDLIDDGAPANTPASSPSQGGGTDGASWMYLNGKWVMVRSGSSGRSTPRPAGGAPADASQPIDLDTPPEVSPVVTQRVIKVPLEDLLAGNAKYNIVVRPGDTIRIPPRATGTYFMMGQISRPGAFNLTDQLTLRNAIAAAGGLGGLAVPERVDLTRMVGDDRAATVRLNLRAIAEGTQPDIYIKPNDNINIGTNFWAYPLAVVRNGFRTNYGFGFLLDRNFGNDVFGAPPRDQGF